MAESTKLQIGKIIAGALELYKKNFVLFFGIALAGCLLYNGAQVLSIRYLQKEPVLPASLMTSTLVGILLALWAVAALIIAVNKKLTGETVNFALSYSQSLKKYPRVFLLNIIAGIAIFTGSLLFIIPGIFAAIIFWLVPAMAVLEEGNFFVPIKKSPILILSDFWRVLLLILAIAAPYFIIILLIVLIFGHRTIVTAVISGVSGILITPFYVGVSVLSYNELKQAKESQIPQMGGAM